MPGKILGFGVCLFLAAIGCGSVTSSALAVDGGREQGPDVAPIGDGESQADVARADAGGPESHGDAMDASGDLGLDVGGPDGTAADAGPEAKDAIPRLDGVVVCRPPGDRILCYHPCPGRQGCGLCETTNAGANCPTETPAVAGISNCYRGPAGGAFGDDWCVTSSCADCP